MLWVGWINHNFTSGVTTINEDIYKTCHALLYITTVDGSEIRLTTRDVSNLVNNGINYIPINW